MLQEPEEWEAGQALAGRPVLRGRVEAPAACEALKVPQLAGGKRTCRPDER
jgi:hypothetical protein